MFLLRRIFFYLFVAIYLIFCPLIIAYALGYIYKPGSELGIIKSGLIYLSTAPRSASVYLGNRRYTRKTPTVLPNLLPGTYPLKLTLKGYRPWFELVPIEAGKATILERILLLPEWWKKRELLAGPFEDLIPIEGTRFFLMKRGSKIGDLTLYDWKWERSSPLVPEDFWLRDAQLLSAFRIQRSPAFLLRVAFEGQEKFLWVVPKPNAAQIKNITQLFSQKPERIGWDPEERKHLFAFQDGFLDELDMSSDTAVPHFLESIQGYGFFNRKIYVLRDDGVFERMDLEGGKEKLLIQDPAFGRSLFGEKGFYQIKVFSEDLMVFWGEEGELLANRLPYRFVEEGVRGFEFYPKLKQLLLWRKGAIGILDFSKKEEEGHEVFEAGPKLKWIYKHGEHIEQAFWVYEGSHILFRDKDKVYLLELETYGKPHLNFLLETKSKSSIFYSDESGILYFIDPALGSLSSVEVLLRKEIIPLPFPERKEEKKPIEIGEL